ncbi:MAG: class IV adenylate cyclase [Candidatus ainarchaeum sp.]|jgi:adenylate cyclase class 2|nr:class IV adenylate cyclase [Candidatus ainarchaeum sp.]
MKEIEILMELLENKNSCIKKLTKIGSLKINKIYDIYYTLDKKIKPNIFPRRVVRIRKKNKESFLTYKIDHYNKNNVWQYSDEYEVKLSDFKRINKIIELIGFKKIIEINNTKYTFETEKYEIVVEDVLNLGLFLEVEIKKPSQERIKTQKDKIRKFIKTLGIKTGKELNKGKPELMIQKKNQLIG